jgi:hypothetical protein
MSRIIISGLRDQTVINVKFVKFALFIRGVVANINVVDISVINRLRFAKHRRFGKVVSTPC